MLSVYQSFGIYGFPPNFAVFFRKIVAFVTASFSECDKKLGSERRDRSVSHPFTDFYQCIRGIIRKFNMVLCYLYARVLQFTDLLQNLLCFSVKLSYFQRNWITGRRGALLVCTILVTGDRGLSPVIEKNKHELVLQR